MKWLRELSVRSKFNIIIVLILIILLYGMVNFWTGLKIMSGVRAYVGGEGLWSKAQKEATNNLIKYSRTFDEADFQNFISLLKVPLGDKIARLEMNRENPNLNVVRLGFIQGGNSPEDVEDLIFLYTRFKEVGHMKLAVDDWTQGDKEIEKLRLAGEKMHDIGLSVGNYEALTKNATLSAKLDSLIDEVYQIDKRLTLLENHFSATLSEGARWMRDFLLLLTLIFSFILGSVVLFIAVYIGKITERVDKMKSEFVSLVSHELRTPLTAIIGITWMIIKGEYSYSAEKLKQPLNDIKDSANHLIRLVNDLLEISRIQSGKLKIDLKEVELNQVIMQNVKIMKLLAKQKGLDIEYINDRKVTVMADEEKLPQILSNLIGNAIKYSNKGQIKLTLSQNKDKVYISVIDNGVGIDKKEQKRLFGRFEQTSLSKESRKGGLGLGLYISKEFAVRMGGNIRLEKSELGKGSTFVIELLKADSKEAHKLQNKLANEFV